MSMDIEIKESLRRKEKPTDFITKQLKTISGQPAYRKLVKENFNEILPIAAWFFKLGSHYEREISKDERNKTMNIDLTKTVTIGELIEIAKGFKSEHGENGEYDRAMLEVITDAARIPQNDRTIIADLIGIPDYIHR